ncbi:sigma-54-dependent Fis family transcriptional regulator [candidate division KSB1 bacterium]|nr:sigma-54-dependent Fis family transcriptional regulator [candidate division KSB1 bacterium]
MLNRKILVIDDEQRMCRLLQAALTADRLQVDVAYDGNEGAEKIKSNVYDIIITDLKMPGKSGIELLDFAKTITPSTEVILMTAYATAQTAVEAMKKGAYDYVIKPFEMTELKLKVKHILEKKQLVQENAKLKEKLKNRYSLENMIGSSGCMQNVYKMVQKVAQSDATVLIRGESGTGKELIAHAIHQLGPRRDKPFIAVNCGALPENLLESELFGHEKGAFTGADKRKLGRFELAGEGSIFLDEIGDMTPSTQIKLLRALQAKEMVRLGGIETIDIKARTISATNRNLEEALKTDQFREDLYYRINVFPITVPPLRERKEDIPDLVAHFLQKYNSKHDNLEPKVLKQLMVYHYPGNVRELENIIERTLIMAGDNKITIEDLPPQLFMGSATHTNLEIPEEGLSLEEVEIGLIQKALTKARGNKSQAAKLLGITRRKLYSMMERLGS